MRITAKEAGKYVPIVGQVAVAGISFVAMKYPGKSHIDGCYGICKQALET